MYTRQLSLFMTKDSEWFKCSNCGEEENVSVKRVLGLGNFSVNIECGHCNSRHVERDASSDNWNKPISIKHKVTGKTIRYPKGSRKIHKMVSCPDCENEEIDVWVYSDNPGLENGETIGKLRLNCNCCSKVEEYSISH